MERVMEKVLEKCRMALLGGKPIVYIKTDSDIFIRQLVLDEENPLVVLLSAGGENGDKKTAELRNSRPIYELKNEQDKKLEYCKNHVDGIPKSENNVRYNMPGRLEDSMPMVWTYKMANVTPEDSSGKAIFRTLEKYVSAHEDWRHPQYQYMQSSIVILYGTEVKLTPILQTYTEVIEVDYPQEEELFEIILREIPEDEKNTLTDEYLRAISKELQGLSVEEAEVTMRMVFARTSLNDTRAVMKEIREQRVQRLQTSILENCYTDSVIGGMESFRKWLEKQKNPINNYYRYMQTTGTMPPKGVLLCGIPGCGKSEAAKFTAQELQLPLLKMDIGSLMDMYQGVSEQRMREALKTAEAMSPCVLWIDEIEKGFSGAGSNGDSSSFKRMFGYMLGWMQSNEKPCFIFATANDIGGLPKEFFRSGRFDALYAVYLPTANECADIFVASVKKAARVAEKAGNKKLFKETCLKPALYTKLINEYFAKGPRMLIGSDIKHIVDEALRHIEREKDNLQNVGYGTNRSGEGEWDNTQNYITIDEVKWQEALKAVMVDESLRVYGDGNENVESIAAGYCRMLRKGFIPTSSQPLFDYKKYVVQKNKEERYDIMQPRGKNAPVLTNEYDQKVYDFLQEKINDVAWMIEKVEQEAIVRR